ncbi:MAG: TlpA family protein disulfide reductase, partial [Candidatus Eremiobacteraeota bacterium]|nr:TlpA family protein disulfide reductase [Candidatus Eremiobacteraeota bacterium]
MDLRRRHRHLLRVCTVRIFGERVACPDRKSRTRLQRTNSGSGARLVICGLLCALLPGALAVRADAKHPPAVPSTGLAPIAYDKPAPDFTYDTGDGPKKLSDARGAPVLVHFWDSWCEPCTDELPLLVRARMTEPNLVVITFSDEENGAAR